MHQASDAFHRAVYENSPEERILLRFAGNTFLSNEDIQVSGGVTVTEAINYEEDLTIGACLSSTFEATIINDHRLLSGYEFGECDVSLGVCTEKEKIAPVNAQCQAVLDFNGSKPVLFTGHSEAPFLRAEGEEVKGVQPDFPVMGLLIEGRTVHCIGMNGEVWSATWLDMSQWQERASITWKQAEEYTWDEFRGGMLEPVEQAEITPFMEQKLRRFARMRRGVWYNAGECYEFYTTGLVKHFEYVPLGIFEMDIPKKRRTDYIEVSSYDRMTLFDVDAADFMNGLSYPITLKELLHKLCEFCEVPLATSGDFINSDIVYKSNPLADDDDVTARDILGWIAGAGCSIARMTRYGELELAWFSTQDVAIPMNQYFDIDITERDVQKIDGLQIASPSDNIDVKVGEGYG